MKERFKSFKIIKEIFPFLWAKQEKIRSLFLISFALVFVSIGLNLSIPIVLKEIVFKLGFSNKHMSYQLSLLLVAYGAIWTLSQTTQQIRQIIMVRPLEKSIRLFCSKLFDHLHSLPMIFHLNRKTGAITNALERAQNGFPNVFWGLFLFVIPTTIELILAAIILCYYYGFTYGFLLFCIAFAFVVFTFFATERASRFQILCNEEHSNTNANIVDSLLNFASIKYFNNKEYEVLKCDAHLRTREKLLIKTISSMEFVRIGQSLIIGAGLVLLTYTAGKQTILGFYDVSDFVLINGYILQFATPLNHIGFIIRDIRRGINELSDTIQIYKLKPATDTEKKSNSIEKLESIEFQDVSFGYEPSHFVIKDVNFKLHAGKTLALVGATGSGKSTISSLLYKFFDINSGKILINNQNIQDINTGSLYELFGIVPQDITLFNTSIYENILFARPSAHKDEIEEVIRLVRLDSVLKKMPNNYNTIVGERGLKLSGGEKQRIAIARVLLKRPSLYILDEATSSLDLSTEKIIMNNIAPILKNATSIIIAHRISTVVNADEILVLNNGIIEERGTHAQLLMNQGLYASLWKTQEAIKINSKQNGINLDASNDLVGCL